MKIDIAVQNHSASSLFYGQAPPSFLGMSGFNRNPNRFRILGRRKLDLFNLQGQHVAIVGASGDIGTAMVQLCLSLGARVYAVDRDEAALARLADDAQAAAALRTFVADVTDEDAMAKAFDGMEGRLDGLVNGAGIENRPVPIDEMDAANFRKVVDVNVTGVFLGMKYGIPLMREQGGSIVNVASTAGIKGAAGMAPYIASKHAVIGLTRTAAIEWGPSDIRVNAICPGPIEGRMIDSIYGSKPGAPSEIARARMAVIPSRRFGRRDEIANVTAFLLSGAATYVNGACYSIDGGISAI
jgi:NAD(P)-dependent dehydrogenase (short-subunit alcohol dehydrogenase family)